MQACREGLLKPHEEIPRRELSSMRMPRQLQVEARLLSGGCGAWLMREQHPHAIRRRAGNGRRRIAAMRWLEMMRAVVGHSRNHQALAGMTQHDVLVHEHPQPEPRELGDPRPRARVVLVVARD